MKYRIRLALALSSIVIYALCFEPAYSFAGLAAGALVVIPVATIGGLFGIRAGIVSGLFSSVFNGLLFILVGRTVANDLAGLLLSDLVFTGVGTLVGGLKGLLTQLREQARQLKHERETLREEIARRKKVEEQLAHDALHDPLTNLPNRTLFLDRLGHALQRTKQHQNDSFAVLYLDLDRFKIVNDSLGHSAGDQLLIETGHRLVASVGTVNTVSRLGGDEFAILLEDAQDVAEATRVADQIQHALAAPF